MSKSRRGSDEESEPDWAWHAYWNLPSRRKAHRLKLSVPVAFRNQSIVGSGVIYDISEVGARIEPRIELASGGLSAGTRRRIDLFFLPESERLSLAAEVVRETCTGFAVRFTEDQEQAKLRTRLAEMYRELAEA